ncbi:MAG: allantoate amidohydrolase [Chloroflexota bacterium]
MSTARRLMERCDALAAISEEPGRLTRRYGTEALRRAQELVTSWMRAAGMTVRRDSVGNLIGRYEAGRAGARTLLLGSHLDTVRDAGRYDGPLGVLAALACVERLHERGERLPFAVEVLAFADEEGLRFRTAYLGSSALAGTFDPAWLERTDPDGITLAEAIRAFGGDLGDLAGARRQAEELIGYCEVHIEQGPVLEALGLPVGVVTAIAGQSRFSISFQGEAGHAGTVPMALRRDALCAAAELVLAAEATARAEVGLVATVGQIEALPGATNVIPGRATLSLDVRHQDDATRRRAIERLRAEAERIAATRSLELSWQLVQEHPPVPMDAALSGLLRRAVEETGLQAHALPSGAGHDAAVLAALAPVAMLFVRCRGGVSHNPAESVAEEDVAAALDVLERFVMLAAEELST